MLKIYYLPNAQPFVNMITTSGTVITFYKGYLKTTDTGVQSYLATLQNVEDVTAKKPTPVVEEPPQRTRTRGTTKSNISPLMTPAELLQRAVTSSAQTPQAAASNSGA